MKAFNSRNRKSKLIVRFLKGDLRLSFVLFEEYHSTIKKSENVFRIRKASFGGRPTIYALNNWLEPKDVNVPKIRLKKTFRRRVYGISNADNYLQAQGITMNRKGISDWLKDPNNKYEVYKWVVREAKQ